MTDSDALIRSVAATADPQPALTDAERARLEHAVGNVRRRQHSHPSRSAASCSSIRQARIHADTRSRTGYLIGLVATGLIVVTTVVFSNQFVQPDDHPEVVNTADRTRHLHGGPGRDGTGQVGRDINGRIPEPPLHLTTGAQGYSIGSVVVRRGAPQSVAETYLQNETDEGRMLYYALVGTETWSPRDTRVERQRLFYVIEPVDPVTREAAARLLMRFEFVPLTAMLPQLGAQLRQTGDPGRRAELQERIDEIEANPDHHDLINVRLVSPREEPYRRYMR